MGIEVKSPTFISIPSNMRHEFWTRFAHSQNDNEPKYIHEMIGNSPDLRLFLDIDLHALN